MGGDSPIQLQDANAHSLALSMLCQTNHSCAEASTLLWLELVRVERAVTAWAWERLGTFVYKTGNNISTKVNVVTSFLQLSGKNG